VNICAVVERLIEIERALGVEDTSTIRRMLWDAQECALQIQKHATEIERVGNESTDQYELPLET
jgi:hypothetical protein